MSGRSGSNLPREYALPGRGKSRRRPRFYRLLTADLRRYGGAPPEAKPCPRRDCNCRLRRQGVSHAAACGDAPLPGRGGCRRPAAGGDLHAAACGDAPLPGRGAKGDRTPRFPIPSCDSPTFLCAAQRSFAAKRGTRGIWHAPDSTVMVSFSVQHRLLLPVCRA